MSLNFHYGLSLCIQGTHPPSRNCQSVIRFIPVYTGNTLARPRVIPALSVYPCVYREHPPQIRANFRKSGLSLCVQGTLAHSRTQGEPNRFIPVCTGNTPTHFKNDFPTHGLSLCVQGTLQL